SFPTRRSSDLRGGQLLSPGGDGGRHRLHGRPRRRTLVVALSKRTRMAGLVASAESLAAFLDELRRQEDQIKLGGGPQASARQHAKHRLTARERITQLLDPHTSLFELG